MKVVFRSSKEELDEKRGTKRIKGVKILVEEIRNAEFSLNMKIFIYCRDNFFSFTVLLTQSFSKGVLVKNFFTGMVVFGNKCFSQVFVAYYQ